MDDESIFTLEQYEDQSGSHLDLIPVGVIDREKFKSAELKMTASNPTISGQMDQSTTVTIHITVLDENEFKPTFTKQVSSTILDPIYGPEIGPIDLEWAIKVPMTGLSRYRSLGLSQMNDWGIVIGVKYIS